MVNPLVYQGSSPVLTTMTPGRLAENLALKSQSLDFLEKVEFILDCLDCFQNKPAVHKQLIFKDEL